MGNSFLNGLLAAVKAKIVPIVTKLRMFMTVQFWRTKVMSKFRDFFGKIFDIKPKDKDDYYGIFSYLVSKRLAYAIVLAIGVISAVYLVNTSSFTFFKVDGVKTYKYNSVMLRFASDSEVRIKAKSGYVAYDGAIEKGVIKGTGKLFDKDGNLVYQGLFDNNKYNGTGTAYYKNGNTTYAGEFVDNLYEGKGKLYREGGTIEYSGEFSNGHKNGEGVLCNESGQPIYTGLFANDDLVYSQLVGKTASEIGEAYTGAWTVYESEDEYCMHMKEIDAIYQGNNTEDSVKDEIVANAIYVMKDEFTYGNDVCKNIKDVKKLFGKALYHGNSPATLPEAIVIHTMGSSGKTFKGPIELNYTQQYDEYCKVEGYDQEYVLYLYTFERDGLLYTFFCKDKDSEFECYSIMATEGGE